MSGQEDLQLVIGTSTRACRRSSIFLGRILSLMFMRVNSKRWSRVHGFETDISNQPRRDLLRPAVVSAVQDWRPRRVLPGRRSSRVWRPSSRNQGYRCACLHPPRESHLV